MNTHFCTKLKVFGQTYLIGVAQCHAGNPWGNKSRLGSVAPRNKSTEADKPSAVWTKMWALKLKKKSQQAEQALTDSRGVWKKVMVHSQKSKAKKEKQSWSYAFPPAVQRRACSSSFNHNIVVTSGPFSVKLSQTNKDKHLHMFVIMDFWTCWGLFNSAHHAYYSTQRSSLHQGSLNQLITSWKKWESTK